MQALDWLVCVLKKAFAGELFTVFRKWLTPEEVVLPKSADLRCQSIIHKIKGLIYSIKPSNRGVSFPLAIY